MEFWLADKLLTFLTC